MYDKTDSETMAVPSGGSESGVEAFSSADELKSSFWGAFQPFAVPLALGLILLLGAVLRFTGINWDDNQHLHPDERFLTMVEDQIRFPGSQDIPGELPAGCREWGGYFDTQCSPLNPYNHNFGQFVYGTFPLFLVKFVGDLLNQSDYGQIFIVGRYLSGLFDLFTVLVIFLIGRRLYGARVGLLAALLLAASVLDIQQSHYFTVDTFANLPLVLAFWFALDIAEGRRGWLAWILAGVFFGLSLAARINLAPFAAILALAGVVFLVNNVKVALRGTRTYAFAAESPADSAVEPSPHAKRILNLGPLSIEVQARRRVEIALEQAQSPAAFWTAVSSVALGLGLAMLAAFIAFRVAQPYAFKGLGLNPQFLADMALARDNVGGVLDVPPMHQWTARPDYWFPFAFMVQWGMGPGLGLAGWLGFVIAGIESIRARTWKHLLTFFWVGGLFLYLGQQVAKTDRYYLPLYPFLAILAAYALFWLWDGVRKVRWPNSLVLPARALVAVVILAAVGYTLFWAGAFTSIYTRPVSRVTASRWILANIPPGAVFGNEHWDDPIPLRVDNQDPYGGKYSGVEMQWYNEDTPEKREQAIQWLDDVTYINLTSNRLYLSIPRLPLRYPLTTKYYEWLFDGKLGFQLVGTFTSRPQLFGMEINDDNAEETFTVYDHPKVLIFKKTSAYSHDNTVALFNSVDLDEVIRQKPIDFTQSHNAFQLSLTDKIAQYAGGTWSDIFHPDDFINQVPVVAWIVLLEVLGLCLFPVTFLVFRKFADRGYALAKALGVLMLGWGAWTLASYHVLAFSRTSIALILLALALLAAFLLVRQWRELLAFVRSQFKILLAEELIFIAFFFFSLWIRYGNPDLWHPAFGGEKPMDFTYLNAIIKSTWFPPYNAWFEGGYINYYYFGQILSATLVKFTGIVPEVAYNLLLPMFFSLSALGAFCVVFNLVSVALARRPSQEEHELLTEVSEEQNVIGRAIAAGLLGAFLVLIIGNLGEIGVLVKALTAMGQPLNSGIPGLGGLFSVLTGAVAWLLERKPFPISLGDWYWSATRVIPDTINEFPFFTFLYADLHAHLMALAYTLVAIAFALHTVLLRARLRWFDLGVIALVLGALRGINTWDYPTYLAAVGGALAIGYCALRAVERTSNDESAGAGQARLGPYLPFGVVAFSQIMLLVIPTNALGIKVTLDVLILALVLVFGLVLGWIQVGPAFDPRGLARSVGWRVMAISALGVLFYLPYLTSSTFGAGTGYSGAELWKGGRTDLQDYLIVHGIFLFIVATYLIVGSLRERAEKTGTKKSLWDNDWALFGIPFLVVFELALIVINLSVFAVVLPLSVLAAWQLLNRESSPERRLIALLILAALLLTAVVEVVVLKGDIGRMNTVFKFYIQSWVLFSVTGAAGLALIFDRLVPQGIAVPAGRSEEASAAQTEPGTEVTVTKLESNTGVLFAPVFVNQLKQIWWGVLGILILIGLLYPIFATWAKVNDRYVSGSPPGLNGMDYMLGATYEENNVQFSLAPDHEAIQWLRKNIQGSPIIAEANVSQYRWGNRIAINTGLPTIIGWDWETKQQYSLIDGSIIDQRLEQLKTLYNTADPNEAMDILKRFDVSYVYVGPLERAIYDATGLDKFDAMASAGRLTKVYDADQVQIYKVNAPVSAMSR